MRPNLEINLNLTHFEKEESEKFIKNIESMKKETFRKKKNYCKKIGFKEKKLSPILFIY
jgi:hypothetical protein